MKLLLLAFSFFLFLAPAYARGGHTSSGASLKSSSTKCSGCARDNRGRIKRSESAKRQFQRTHPRPSGCKDCVVDHVVPLKRGGADSPSNMQWQTKEAAKAKDKVE